MKCTTTGVLATVLLLVSLLTAITPDAQAQGSFDQELIRLTNNHRASIGRAPLVSSSSISAGAASWSTTMRTSGNFRHATNLGSLGENIAFSHGPVGVRVGVSWSTAAGRLPSYCTSSMDYTSAQFIMCSWLSSPGHRRAIENANYRQVGSGTSTGPGSFGRETYSTMRFSAAAPAPTAAPVPATDNVFEPGHSIATNTDGDVVVLATKRDGTLYIRRNLGSGWSSWRSLGSGGWASADVTITPSGVAHIAAVKADGTLFTNRWAESGSFGSWINHGSGWATRTSPSISTNASKVILGAIRANGALITKTRTGSWSGSTVQGSGGWASVDVDIASDGDIWFAAVKTDGRLFVRKNINNNWSGFASMGKPDWSTTTPPAIGARSNGVVFAAAKADGRLYTREQSNNVWAGWVRQGLTDWASVDVDISEDGHISFAAIKNWGALYIRERAAAGAWGSWAAQGRSTWSANASPSISGARANTLVFVAVKTDGLLYQRSRAAGRWSSWAKLGAGSWAPGK